MKSASGNLIQPGESLLLVIDLQEKFVPYLKHSLKVLQSADLLLHTAEVLNMPVVLTEQHPEAIGPTVDPVSKHLDRVEKFRKDSFGCFGDEAIKKAVTEKPNIKNILITGCETHICVMQTTLQALDLGYGVHVAADGVSSRSELDWRVGLERIREAGAVVATCEMIAYELLRKSDTPEFKKLLPVFKNWTSRE